MADNLDEVFGGDELEPVEVQAETPQDSPIDTPEHVDAEEPPVEAQPEPAPVEEKREDHIPLAKYLDQRDELKEMRRKVAEYEAKNAAVPKQSIPDPLDDVDGFNAYQEQRVQQAVTQQRFQFSEMMAKEAHGEEAVTKASEWALERASQDPAFAAAYHRQAHPIDWIVQQHKRDAILSDIGDNVDDWFTKEAAKRGYAPANVAAPAPAVAQTQQATPPAKVPRSLATQGSGPTDVRQVASGPTAAVDALFS